MSVNPIDKNSTPKTNGSLEELFRHHLGEEAAVPPRPMLWDQIDNSLLIRQNETYRRRLAATRWVAAASLLLATLAGTGWWAGRHELLGGAEMAANRPSAASGTRTGIANSTETLRSEGNTYGLKAQTSQRNAPVAANGVATSTNSSGNTGSRIGTTDAAHSIGDGYVAATRSTLAPATPSSYTGFGSASVGQNSTRGLTAKAGLAVHSRNTLGSYATNTPDAQAVAAARATQSSATSATNPTVTANALTLDNASTLAVTEVAGVGAASTTAALGASATTLATAPGTTAITTTEGLNLLVGRQTALNLADATALPNGLATVPVEELPAVDVHHWRYSASYAAGMFNPNVNFSRAGIEPEFDYNRGPAFGTDSPTLTEAAATEYRNNLRPGLSQRIALLATRHLRGHWSLSTGAEFTQATAQSASSSAFVGEQLFDLSQGSTAQPLRTTNFRYQMASIPLEVRYSNPVKRGWSIYGRLGGVVTALLGVRSDVQGDPEATRTYSITSTGGPYRRLMGSVRGGAGAQFRPSTSKWAFSVGPTADLGLVALNAHPVQSYFAQSHPYSVGLEASVEFGR